LPELLLLLLLAGAIAWVVQLRRQPPLPTGSALVGPGPGLGRPVRVVFLSSGDSVVVERTADGFAIVHPLRDRANPGFLEEVLRYVRDLKSERVLVDAAGAYGLDGPGPGLRLADATGHSWILRLGDDVPAGSLVYARIGPSSEPPLLLDRFESRKFLQPELKTVRDPAPTDLRPGPVDSVAVLVAGRDFRAGRVERDRWLVRTPAGLRADPAPLNGVVQLLRDPTILEFPPEGPLAALGLDPPRATWILCQGSRRDTVRIGRATPTLAGVYILPSGRTLPAVLPSDRFRELVDGWPGLADRRLLRVPIDSVDVIEFPGRAASFRREAGTWRAYPGARELARAAALQQDLVNLASLRWRRYPEAAAAPPRDLARLAVRLATPARAETLFLAAPPDSEGWARATAAPRWGRVSPAAWSAWFHHATHGE
jgi:hypothetical protein